MSDTLISHIKQLKGERKAIILAHTYQRPEVQDLADYVGDSLGLSRTAATTEAEVIVFCGVHFMAETAALLSPQKKVLIPDSNAGCPMADMITPRELREFKAEHPAALVVTYVNSSAAIKAQSDVCCTSANALDVVARIPAEREVIFIPDRNLGAYIATQLKRKLIIWPGFCPTHNRMLPEDVSRLRREHPEALLVAHPECRPSVVEMADHVASTTGIIKFCRESQAREFIVGTENGVLHILRNENPDKLFHALSVSGECPNMKLINLNKIAWCLEDMAPQVSVDPEWAAAARLPIQRMLELGQTSGTPEWAI
jgi:quinolinate synthase